VVEHLPSKHKALSSVPALPKREGGREKGREKEEEGEKVANVSYLIDDSQVDSHLFGGKWVLRHPRSHCDGLFLPVVWFL
jgi:hypothetical protein